MAKKAKWLEESSTVELLDLLNEILEGDLDDKEIKKAKKVVAEIIERTPEDGAPSVEEALAQVEAAINVVKEAYQAELAAIDEEADIEEEVQEEEEEVEEDTEEEEDEDELDLSSMTAKELKKHAKGLGLDVKGVKGKDALIELIEGSDYAEEEADEDEDAEGTDYEDWATKDLKAECRERGIKVTKGMKKADFIKALEADDKE